MTLGQRLKNLRKQKKWTLKEVAEKLNLSGHSTYSNWEYERTEPDVEMLKNIADLFEVSIGYLMTGNNENMENKKMELEYDLEQIVKMLKQTKTVTWGKEVLSEEEKGKAIQLLTILLDKQKDTSN